MGYTTFSDTPKSVIFHFLQGFPRHVAICCHMLPGRQADLCFASPLPLGLRHWGPVGHPVGHPVVRLLPPRKDPDKKWTRLLILILHADSDTHFSSFLIISHLSLLKKHCNILQHIATYCDVESTSNRLEVMNSVISVLISVLISVQTLRSLSLAASLEKVWLRFPWPGWRCLAPSWISWRVRWRCCGTWPWCRPGWPGWPGWPGPFYRGW